MKSKEFLVMLCTILAVTFTAANAQRHMQGVNHVQIEGGFFDSFEDQSYNLGIYFLKCAVISGGGELALTPIYSR